MLKLVKNNKDYIPQECYNIQPPFSFIGPGICMVVPEGAKPVYFERIVNTLERISINEGNVKKIKSSIYYGYIIDGLKVVKMLPGDTNV